MNILKLIPEISTFFLLPIGVIIAYIQVRWKMGQADLEKAPKFQILFSYLHFGGLIMLLMIKNLLEWTAIAQMSFVYLVLFAPMIQLFTGIVTMKNYSISPYHKFSIAMSFGYLFIAIGIITYLYINKA